MARVGSQVRQMKGVVQSKDPYGEKLPRQRITMKIHRSTEHKRMTPVFGTSCPPRLMSGLMRDLAYRYSEGQMSHWLLLLAADRVDVVESTILEAFRLKFPRLIKETGLKTELLPSEPHERVQRYAMTAGMALGAMALGFLATRAVKRLV